MEIDDRVRIATPEGLDVDLVVAGLGSRFIGFLVDIVLQSLLILALTLGLGSFGNIGAAGATIGIFVVSLLYPVLFETFDDGRSPGKRLAGLRVVNLDGTRITFLTSAVRNALRVIDALPGTFTVGIVAIVMTARHQRVGDLAAGTIVVRHEKVATRPATGPAPIDPFARLTLPPGATTWDVSAITTDELAAVRSFLERRLDLTPPARIQVATELASRLAGKVAGVPMDAGPERFLEHVVQAKLER